MSIAFSALAGAVLALLPLLFSQLITSAAADRNQGAYRALALATAAVIAFAVATRHPAIAAGAFALTAAWRLTAFVRRLGRGRAGDVLLDQAVSPQMQATLAKLEQQARAGTLDEAETDSTNRGV